MQNSDNKKGEMTVSEAGRAGGHAVVDKYGIGYMQEIGKRSGDAAKERGTDYEGLGRAGGQATLEKYGPEHYRELAKRRWRKCGRCGARPQPDADLVSGPEWLEWEWLCPSCADIVAVQEGLVD